MGEFNQSEKISEVKIMLNIEEFVNNFIKGIQGNGKCLFKPDDILSLDSLNVVSLIIEIENEYGFEFNEDDINLNNFSSINSIKKTVKKYLIN
jgi:hypothetical protein